MIISNRPMIISSAGTFFSILISPILPIPKMPFNKSQNPFPVLFLLLLLLLPALSHGRRTLINPNGTLNFDQSAAVYLWPLPKNLSSGLQTLTIDPDLSLDPGGIGGNSLILLEAFGRYKDLIFKDNRARYSRRRSGQYDVSKLTVIVSSDNETLQFGVDESYELYVGGDNGRGGRMSIVGGATIEASTIYGALRGLEPPYQVGPPATRRQPGRPKGVRRREADELPRSGKKQRICGRCKLPADHNARGCQGGPVGGNQRTPRPPRPPRPPKEPKQRVPRKTNTTYKRPKTSRGKKKDAVAMGAPGGPQIPSSPQQSGPSNPTPGSSNLLHPTPGPSNPTPGSFTLLHPSPAPPHSSTIPFKSGSEWIHQNLGMSVRTNNIAAILPPRRPMNSVFRPPWNTSARVNIGSSISSNNSNNPSILEDSFNNSRKSQQQQ